jgi:hypothetical protein
MQSRRSAVRWIQGLCLAGALAVAVAGALLVLRLPTPPRVQLDDGDGLELAQQNEDQAHAIQDNHEKRLDYTIASGLILVSLLGTAAVVRIRA